MARSLGDDAPDFSLPASSGQTLQLRSLLGRRILLIFYSFSYDDVCRDDLRWLRERADRLKAETTHVVAVSCDPPPVQYIWWLSESYPFPLLSDFWPHGEVSEAFGVFDRERGRARHVIFSLDLAGRIVGSFESGYRIAHDDEVFEQALACMAPAPPADVEPLVAGVSAPTAGRPAPPVVAEPPVVEPPVVEPPVVEPPAAEPPPPALVEPPEVEATEVEARATAPEPIVEEEVVVVEPPAPAPEPAKEPEQKPDPEPEPEPSESS